MGRNRAVHSPFRNEAGELMAKGGTNMEEKARAGSFYRVAIFIILGVALFATGCATGAKGTSGGAGESRTDYRGIEPTGNPSDTDWPNPMSK